MLWPLLVMAVGFMLLFFALLLLRMRTACMAAKVRALQLLASDAPGVSRRAPGTQRWTRRDDRRRRRKFLAMGGYARFVWPAYGVAAVGAGRPRPRQRHGLSAPPPELAQLERGRRAAMTRKRRRLYLLLGGMATLGVGERAGALRLQRQSRVLLQPERIALHHHVPDGRYVRIGGLVEQGSVATRTMARPIAFRVTDGRRDLEVEYRGAAARPVPRGPGRGRRGRARPDGMFRAAEVLAKHDEKYMPREVADALKKSGQWQEGETTATVKQ